MKSYGHDRRDKLACAYGCCDYKKGSVFANCRAVCDRRAKKRARAVGKADCRSDA